MQSANVPNVWRPRAGVSLERLRRTMHTAEQTLFLRRLEDLLEKRQLHTGLHPDGDWRRRLIDKALYSTYRDCLDLSVGDEARELLQRGREELGKVSGGV